jgi:hypothetical protein
LKRSNFKSTKNKAKLDKWILELRARGSIEKEFAIKVKAFQINKQLNRYDVLGYFYPR